jgi:hypothetical protein
MSLAPAKPRQLVPLLLVPALFFVVLYGRSLDYDFVWTDQGEIELGLIIVPPDEIHTALGRPMLSGLDALVPGASAPYYRPLQVIAASLIDHHLGREPRNFRALNLLLGMLTASGVAWLAWLLFASPAAALGAGMIYAAHPGNLENYVWIAGLSQSLASFFITACLASGVLALRGPGAPGWMLASLGALLAALLSKENAAITPILSLALAISVVALEDGDSQAERRRELLRRARLLLALQLAITVAFVLFWRPHVLGTVLAEATPLAGSAGIQIFTGVATWPGAMSWLFFPLQSTTSDVVAIVASPLDTIFLSGLVLAGLSLAIWWRLLAAHLVWAALGLAWIWIAFAPTSGLIPLNHLRGERYLSLSLLGLAVLLPALGLMLQARFEASKQRWIVPLLACALIFGLAQRSWHRMPDWRSDLTLFASDVARDPLYREGYHELAKARISNRDLRGAKESLDTLSRLDADFAGYTSFLRAEDAIQLLCQVNLELGAAQDSMRYFDSLSGDSPQLASVPATSLCGARSLRVLGRADQATAVLVGIHERAPEPYPAQAAVELADMSLAAGRVDDARRWISRVDKAALQDPILQRRLDELRNKLAAER